MTEKKKHIDQILHQAAGDEQVEKMTYKGERREFNRLQIEFWMEVSLKDKKGVRFEEKTVLRNISGGGANFVTHIADQYYPGQELQLTLFLPGTHDMNARMKAKARVMRIDPWMDSDPIDTDKKATVAVKFATILNFER